MPGIWSQRDGRWVALEPTRFALEQELHDLIEAEPGMLPLAGAPQLAVLGREVRCGSGYADLVAVEAATGRPVVVEIKLASNTDRRAVLTQVLGYAAHLRRLDTAGFEALLAPHLAKRRLDSIDAGAAVATANPAFDDAAFRAALSAALDEGRLRCVVVIDEAPADLIELVGYLQDVSNERLDLDLVTVTAYDVGGRRVLVPQLIEPERAIAQPMPARALAPEPAVTDGPGVFATAIDTVAPDRRPLLQQLLAWAIELETGGLATLHTAAGRDRWTLRVHLRGQRRGLVTLWNENGGYVSPFRSVFLQVAPDTLRLLDERYPGEIGAGNYVRTDDVAGLLELLTAAYREAAG
ncbi:hypothetical protein [Jiangella alba]|uniref:DUF91 domain-containing protein n=1 Tax=Jiangella alba TaxID=561176 RepID=A0A1H5JT70_9ACTN|nr:hypothetical protein [Jiangella alba]SEE55604.1 hypothetical protein SAMN04488561_1725 [Jiangella alba]